MSKLYDRIARQWRDGANFALGLWLLASPLFLGYADVSLATWNAYILGAIIAVSALAALIAFHEWEEWVSAAFGVWLIVSPWVLGFTVSALATWNHVVVGVLVAAMAGWTIWLRREHGEPRKA